MISSLPFSVSSLANLHSWNISLQTLGRHCELSICKKNIRVFLKTFWIRVYSHNFSLPARLTLRYSLECAGCLSGWSPSVCTSDPLKRREIDQYLIDKYQFSWITTPKTSYLHRYTHIVMSLSYRELLALNEQQLEKMGVTKVTFWSFLVEITKMPYVWPRWSFRLFRPKL